MTLGARIVDDNRTGFRVWAPIHDQVVLRVHGGGGARDVTLDRDPRGYHATVVGDAPVGTRYEYVIGGVARPDPASRWQPDGPGGSSAVVDHRYPWTDDAFRSPGLDELVVYELHVGTFSREGTFAGVVPELESLRDLGITAIELMPVAEFPGARNWGYDGVMPFAAQSSYGGPDGLPRARRRRARDGTRGHPRRRVQPPRSRGERARRVRPLFH